MPSRVLVLGATGTIGRATVRALVAQGHEVVCLIRQRGPSPAITGEVGHREFLSGATVRPGDATDPVSLTRDGFKGERFDVLVSCLASRTGEPADAWAVDHRATVSAIEVARTAGVKHVVLLSAICVQKPLLAFQHAKLAAEQALIASGLRYSIVRPTAFFKSLSGQVERVRRSKPFLLFGDGRLTACTPISDADLGAFIAGCITDVSCHDRILPIGGPGPAMTPREQGEALFRLLGREPRFRQVPLKFMDVIVAVLATLGRVFPRLADKAELARIGRYYATESMLVMDPATGRYEASLTPSTGTDRLVDYHAALLRGEASLERGDHAVF